MEEHFASAPAGFGSAVASLNAQKPPSAPLLPRENASETNALEYIFRGLANCSATAEDIKRLTGLNDDWSAAVAAALPASSSAPPLQLGALDSVNWKIGVAMESSKCARLASPFVSLVLNIRDEAGAVVPTTLELSLEEFASFSRKVEEAASVLETL